MQRQEIKQGEIILYKDKQGLSLEVKLEKESVWLTQNQIAVLFDVKKAAISKHIKNIFKDGELQKKSTVSKMETVQDEGGRKIKRLLTYYNLDMIISVGYRVNSKRATQFRIWATKTLKEHLIKGYTMNEKRLLQVKDRLKDIEDAIQLMREKSSNELLANC